MRFILTLGSPHQASVVPDPSLVNFTKITRKADTDVPCVSVSGNFLRKKKETQVECFFILSLMRIISCKDMLMKQSIIFEKVRKIKKYIYFLKKSKGGICDIQVRPALSQSSHCRTIQGESVPDTWTSQDHQRNWLKIFTFL